MNAILSSILGGALIGVAASLMLLWTGRVTGVSGIVNGAFKFKHGDSIWRWFFILGLVMGGIILRGISPDSFGEPLKIRLMTTVIGGLLVGFGTVLGGGCTSGHGICGISRFSKRSFAATGFFILGGIVSATAVRVFFAGCL